jgi:hypothetical protein
MTYDYGYELGRHPVDNAGKPPVCGACGFEMCQCQQPQPRLPQPTAEALWGAMIQASCDYKTHPMGGKYQFRCTHPKRGFRGGMPLCAMSLCPRSPYREAEK